MADGTEATAAVSDDPAKSEEHEGESGADVDGEGLTAAQTELLEKCLHSLKHAKNDSHTLAALLLVRLGNQGCKVHLQKQIYRCLQPSLRLLQCLITKAFFI